MYKKLIRLYQESTKVQEFVKFCIVGFLCTIIDGAGFYATRTLVGYQAAMIIGWTVSIAVNYFLNVRWSFRSKPTLKNAFGLIGANLFNILVVRMSLMWFFINVCYMTDSMAFIPTLAISVITNFIIVRFAVTG